MRFRNLVSRFRLRWWREHTKGQTQYDMYELEELERMLDED